METQDRSLLTPDRKKVTDQWQIWWNNSFTDVPYRNIGVGLQVQKQLKDSYITRAHPSLSDSS